MKERYKLRYTVTYILPDKDASTIKIYHKFFKIFKKAFVIVLYLLTLNNFRSWMKNFKRKLEKLGKKFPEVKNLAFRSAKYLARIIKESKESNFVFHTLLKQKLKYYCGNYKSYSFSDSYKRVEFVDYKEQKAFKIIAFIIL
jgi:hypothetical protein